MNVPPGVIDLGVGQPQNALAPERADAPSGGATVRQRRAASTCSTARSGATGTCASHSGAYLTDAYGCPVEAEHLFITNGNSQALDLICTCSTEPGDVVIVEEPTYFLALDIFRDHRVEVVECAASTPTGSTSTTLDVELDAVAGGGTAGQVRLHDPDVPEPDRGDDDAGRGASNSST